MAKSIEKLALYGRQKRKRMTYAKVISFGAYDSGTERKGNRSPDCWG